MADIGLFSADLKGRPLPSDPTTRADIEQVLSQGFVVLTDVFTPAECTAAKAEIQRLSGTAPKLGRTSFEGRDTTRIYSLLNKSRVFDRFAMLPRVLALNDYFLDPGYMISAFHTIQINPGEAPQALHHDDGFCAMPRPRPPLGSAILLAFDAFTETNGATRVIPGSHRWGGDKVGTDEEAVPACCPAGSAVYFIATTWHGGGRNVSDKPRMSATVQYCQPYIRQIENQLFAVDPRRLPDLPPKIVEMMGYRTHRPFIGYTDGLSPLKAARRLGKWLQRPLDPEPPAFAEEHEWSKL